MWPQKRTLEQWQNVRVLQVGGGLDLAEKTLGADHRGELGSQHLDGDFAIVLEVLCEVHRGHATGAQLPLETVAVGEGGSKPRENVGHVGQFVRTLEDGSVRSYPPVTGSWRSRPYF